MLNARFLLVGKRAFTIFLHSPTAPCVRSRRRRRRERQRQRRINTFGAPIGPRIRFWNDSGRRRGKLADSNDASALRLIAARPVLGSDSGTIRGANVEGCRFDEMPTLSWAATRSVPDSDSETNRAHVGESWPIWRHVNLEVDRDPISSGIRSWNEPGRRR